MDASEADIPVGLIHCGDHGTLHTPGKSIPQARHSTRECVGYGAGSRLSTTAVITPAMMNDGELRD